MRIWATFIVAILFAAALKAQDQEGKLIDRVLKPNMSLANEAQNKRFVASGSSIDKKAAVSAFYSPNKSIAKHFGGERQFAVHEFGAPNFQPARATADLSARSILQNAQHSYTTRAAPAFRAGDSNKAAAVSSYADNRPFLDRGKSQKALSQQDRPMTIDEVRELLNKNK